MTTKIYWIHTFENTAKIGIMARPRGNDWLEDEIKSLKNRGVTVLVSLLERDEIYDLELEKEEFFCNQNDIEFINFPISDRNIPSKSDKLEVFIENLAKKIEGNQYVAIHCRMGIGRSSIIAAAVLQKFNFKTNEIIEKICDIRALKVPDTDEQLDWLRTRENSQP